MGARDLFDALDADGLDLIAEGTRLLVGPAARLTDEWRRLIIENKPLLLNLAPRRQWRISIPGRQPFGATCPQGATAAEIRAQWPLATVEPLP